MPETGDFLSLGAPQKSFNGADYAKEQYNLKQL